MENNRRKYIIVPEFKPLFALAKAFGPTHGPLDKPCPTTLDVIGKLLQQKGADAVTVYEVVKLPSGGFSEPVKLTRANYTMDYADIAAGKDHATPKAVVESKPAEPVKATVITGETKPVDMFKQLDNESQSKAENDLLAQIPASAPAAETPVAPEISQDEPADAPTEPEEAAPAADTGDAPSESDGEEDVADTPEDEAESDEVSPYAGMTKAERKAARRAARAAKAAEEAIAQEKGE